MIAGLTFLTAFMDINHLKYVDKHFIMGVMGGDGSLSESFSVIHAHLWAKLQ